METKKIYADSETTNIDVNEKKNEEMLQLVFDVTQQLLNDDNQSILKAMNEILDFFNFNQAFIYEINHLKQLNLKENINKIYNKQLIKKISFEDYFSTEEISIITKNPIIYIQNNCITNELNEKISKMFNLKDYILFFIINDDKSITGCIGIASYSGNNCLEKSDYKVIEQLLRLLSGKIRLRIYKQQLKFTNSTLENIMDHIGIDIYVNDFETHEMLYANQSMAAPYGGWENMQGKTCYQALYDNQNEICSYCPKKFLIDENGNPSNIYSWDYQRPFDKSWFRVISSAFKWTDGRLAQVISSVNITQEKNNELIIEKLAYTDDLTGIGNRVLLQENFKKLALKSQAHEIGITIFFADLNNFKEINDNFGHSAGDSILKQIANVISTDDLTKNNCYRYGGDEFIFLYFGLSVEESKIRHSELLELFSRPLLLDGQNYSCSASIGYARFPEDGKTYEELLDNADNRMYAQKSKFHSSKAQ